YPDPRQRRGAVAGVNFGFRWRRGARRVSSPLAPHSSRPGEDPATQPRSEASAIFDRGGSATGEVGLSWRWEGSGGGCRYSLRRSILGKVLLMLGRTGGGWGE